ncbi:MarR family transcriptional regulator [Fictibacillus sp. Mic-4]|uniref:MarR family winged helix-turn-helix transcriptional regulator n=1 Tax=Fictibacillus TaxID=1329200 RepID=UPI0003FBCC1A|nr:MarR family transcriptional regulator [Fictibacillus gelatini]
MLEERSQLLSQLEKSFRNVFRTFRKDINELFSEYMPGNEFSVLQQLNMKSPQMASELAREMKVSSSHITAVTDRLIKKEMVTRKRDEVDRRIVRLEITEKGKETAKHMEELRSQYYIKKFEHLSNHEIKTMLELFNRLI